MSNPSLGLGNFFRGAARGKQSGRQWFESDSRTNVILSEEQFHQAFENERKRTERSGNPFILMSIGLDDVLRNYDKPQSFGSSLIALLSSSIRKTDVVGWYQDQSVMGVIFTEITSSANPTDVISIIRNKVLQAIRESLGDEIAAELVLSFYAFPRDLTDSLSQSKKTGARGSGWLQSKGKRVFDIGGSLLALLIALPIFCLIALAIKLTSTGPVLFRQERIGRMGKRFTFLKFRSMHVDNDTQIHQNYVLQFIAGSGSAGTSGVYKLTNDPRVTWIGRILRKTSLDELPQFWNVLVGDMSLVGPRPPLPYEVEVYRLWHHERFLSAKPGITGLWQVGGRSRVSFDEMVRLDLRYVHKSSFWLDLQILWRTPLAVFEGSGAY